jgi:hypothetical protein
MGPRLVQQAPLLSVAFSQDGKRIVTASEDHRARVWDAQTGELFAPIMESPHALEMASFGLEDRAVVGACEDGTVRIWDSRTGEPLIPPLQHGSWIGVGVRYQRAMLLARGRVLFTFMMEPRHWELPTDNRSLEQWEQIAQLLSAQHFNAKGELEPLDRTSLSNVWHALHSQSPADFTSSPARLYDWNIWRAETCLAEWNAAGALPHLNALVAAEPERLRFRWQRSRVSEALRRWDMMVEDLRVAIHLAPNERLYRTRLAGAELLSENQPGYQAACASLAEHLRADDTLDTISEAIQLCCYGSNLPSATLSLLRTRLQPFEKEHRSGKRYNRSLARLNFREGHYKEALAALMIVQREDMSESDRIFRAMCHRALGQKDEADFWMARAHAHLDATANGSDYMRYGSELPAVDRLLSRLLAEADAMGK